MFRAARQYFLSASLARAVLCRACAITPVVNMCWNGPRWTPVARDAVVC